MLARGRKFGNDTLDVANKGCFDPFDTLACVRTSVLTVAAAITLIFVILKIVKYHVYRHPQMHHYAIFYVSAVECLVCGASFMAGSLYPQLDFTACFLKLLQFTIICHLHWSLAARTLHREDIVQHLINPVLCLYILYCTTVALMGMVDVTGTWTECMRPYWFMLSIADFSIVQLFAVAGICVTYRTEGVSSLASFKSSQRRDLWSVIIVYEFSALLAVAFDAITRFFGSEKDGCSSLFAHTQFFYSLIIAVFMVAKFLVPTWTILWVFQPVEGDTRNSEDGTTDSVSSSIRGYHQYQRMFIPSEQEVSRMNGIPRLPYVSEFTSLHTEFGDYAFPDVCPDCPLSNGPQKKVIMGGVTATGLSTISEESGNISVVDGPLDGRQKIGPGDNEAPRLQYCNYNC
ncbi:uncharacterized protein LOC110833902 isoform X2 [Zootermopsis nevadensis]|uniref:uncharacterized protein LOC110833902 isoform X2 n=1 Tax=Zootermopsis nevadensis TaxID=136037 RepID=UPI000B8E4E30|nr:uncharacterized protein LOC110833902 isoform X2 [Zootermopsis nevadensis]